MYRLKSIQSEYLTCRTWNGTTEGGTDIYVAKNHKLRCSIASAVIDGVTVTYTYPLADNVSRTATITTTSEDQVIVPRYLVNDLIFAVESSSGTGVSGKTLIDLNVDGRAWAKTT
jgi:hypothetical protein